MCTVEVGALRGAVRHGSAEGLPGSSLLATQPVVAVIVVSGARQKSRSRSSEVIKSEAAFQISLICVFTQR